MAELIKPDICVIGAGAGGLSVAAAAAAFGVPVVLIEKNRMGGECLNAGCVPSKALLAAAKRVRAISGAGALGISVPEPTINFERVHDHVHGVIAAIAPNDSKARFTGLGVRVIEGAARFIDHDTVAVSDNFEIKARRFVIAAGSSPAIPPIPDLASAPYLTTESIFDLTACPEHLIVIGAGPVGLELAQAFRRLGASVTVLDSGEPLAREDHECVRIVLDRVTHDGVVLRSGVSIERVDADGSGVAGRPRGAARSGSPAAISWSQPDASPTSKGWVSMLPASSTARRHRHRPWAQDQQQARLCDRRRRWRAAIHPRRQLSRRPGDPECAVPAAGEGR